MTTHHPPVRQTPICQQEGSQAAVDTLSRALLTLSPRASVPAPFTRPPQEEFGPADEPPPQAAGEHCSPGGAGRLRQEASPPAVRAVPPAAASPPVLSYLHPSTASPPGQSCPRPADTSHPPLRGDHPPSDPFLLFIPFYPAITGHPQLGHRPRHSGYSTGPLDTCHGRVPVQRVVMSNRRKVVQQKAQHCQKLVCFHLLSVFPPVRVILATKQQTTSSAIFPCTPNKPRSPI